MLSSSVTNSAPFNSESSLNSSNHLNEVNDSEYPSVYQKPSQEYETSPPPFPTKESVFFQQDQKQDPEKSEQPQKENSLDQIPVQDISNLNQNQFEEKEYTLLNNIETTPQKGGMINYILTVICSVLIFVGGFLVVKKLLFNTNTKTTAKGKNAVEGKKGKKGNSSDRINSILDEF